MPGHFAPTLLEPPARFGLAIIDELDAESRTTPPLCKCATLRVLP
jgi:hypothetical protein